MQVTFAKPDKSNIYPIKGFNGDCQSTCTASRFTHFRMGTHFTPFDHVTHCTRLTISAFRHNVTKSIHSRHFFTIHPLYPCSTILPISTMLPILSIMPNPFYRVSPFWRSTQNGYPFFTIYSPFSPLFHHCSENVFQHPH